MSNVNNPCGSYWTRLWFCKLIPSFLYKGYIRSLQFQHTVVTNLWKALSSFLCVQLNLYTSGIFTGYWEIQCAQGDCCDLGCMVRRACHTALLHLNPLPKAICQTWSPLRILPFASMYSYQIEDEEVLPNQWRVIREGSQSSGVSCRFFSSASITPLPPAWMQKCWNASLKSGM